MKTKLILITAGVILLGTAVTAAWLVNRPDPDIVKLQNLRERMSDATDEERRAVRTEMRESFRNLSDDQRRQISEQWMDHMEERMNSFFALPPEEQERELDQQIDRMVGWRKEREQRSQSGEGARRGGPGRGGGEARGGRGGWQNMTESQRDERRKQRLDRTSAKMRAQFTEYRRMMRERMEARGVEGGGRGGPWGGGGGA